MKQQIKNFPKLQLPEEEFPGRTYLYHSCLSENEDSFGHAIHHWIKYGQENLDPSFTYSNNDPYYKEKVEAACFKLNCGFERIREEMDEHLQEYLLSHDGKIDCWGDSAGSGFYTIDDNGSVECSFDYFGADYKVETELYSKKCVRTSPQFVYRNCYKYKDTFEFYKLDRERVELVKKMESLPKPKNIFYCLIALACFLYVAFSILVSIAGFFYDFEPLLSHEGKSDLEYTVLLVLFLSGMLANQLIIFAAEHWSVLWVVIFVPLALMVLMAIFYPAAYLFEQHKRSTAIRAIKKEIARITGTSEYKEKKAENDRLRKLNEDLAEQWHRAWFEWICSVRQGPKN